MKQTNKKQTPKANKVWSCIPLALYCMSITSVLQDVALEMFRHSWNGYHLSVGKSFKRESECVSGCVCVHVLLQSKWPFGKASRVIIVNYSLKLRVLLRGKQSKWASRRSTSCKSNLLAEQTLLADPVCLLVLQAYWVSKLEKEI